MTVVPTLFPLSEYWWLYVAFTGGVLVLLALDLGVFHRDGHEVRFREAAGWSAIWVSLALTFNVGLYQYALWAFPQDPRQSTETEQWEKLFAMSKCALRERMERNCPSGKTGKSSFTGPM